MEIIDHKSRRAHLKKTKPLVYDKIIHFDEKFDRGETITAIDFAYSYDCNFSCKHCSANNFVKKERVFTVPDVKSLADQADRMGLAQFIISGGEPLLFKELDEIIEAIGPDRFNISLNTNGYLLTYERAKHLKDMGVDKIRVSVDNIDPAWHEKNRNKAGAYSKAMEALQNIKKAGAEALMQPVFTHETARSESALKLAQFAKENGFIVDYQVAKPVGGWAGRYDLMLDDDDVRYLNGLSEDYPIRRDMTPGYGNDPGCLTVKKLIHITKYGDVLPCPFIHISLGNIFEEPFQDIINRGFTIKYFRERQEKCLCGQDKEFVKKYISKTYDRPNPVSYKEIFTDESDYIR